MYRNKGGRGGGGSTETEGVEQTGMELEGTIRKKEDRKGVKDAKEALPFRQLKTTQANPKRKKNKKWAADKTTIAKGR